MKMFTWHSESADVETFEKGLMAILAQSPLAIIILSCSANHYPEDEINTLLENVTVPICGGIYPNAFIGNKLLERGVVFIGLPFKVVNTAVENVSGGIDSIDDFDELINKDSSLKKSANTLIFYDGLMANTEVFLDELHSVLEQNITIIGGGAGNLDFVQRPCIYTNNGLKSDTIQLVELPTSLISSIAHGWQILEGPFLVSESEGAIIESLNYQPAYSVYKETVEKLSDYQFASEDFFEIAKNFPLGIESINGELLVRDPIVINNEKIQCVGNVPINSMVYILKGEKDLLIESVVIAQQSAFERSLEPSFSIVFDCISRKLYLENDFSQELNALTKQGRENTAFGVLSLGEIANDGGGAIKLLNKSTVIGLF